MNWNLKYRILVPTLAQIIVITAALVAVAFFLSRSALTAVLDEQLSALSVSAVSQVENFVGGQRQNLTQWATQPEMLLALQSGAEAEAARQGINRELANAFQLYGLFEEIQLADLRGETLASSNAEMIGKMNVSERRYFQDAAAGRNAISEVLRSKSTGNPVVVIATPVNDGHSVRGVLYGVLDLASFSDKIIGHIKVLRTGYAALYDEHGAFIAHPDKRKILQTKISEFDWGRRMLQMGHGELDYTFEGVTKRAAFRTSDMLHWGFMVTVPQSELEAPIYHMGIISVAIGLGALAMAAVASSLTARSVARPIQHSADQLSAGANEIAAAAGQVSTTSQNLASGASEQAAAAEETSSSLEELSSMTKRNADNATKVNELAKQTRTAADKGVSDMEAMSAAMNDIKASSDDVAKIIKTIDEIAFQTNILALNAAVEAARAGEAGAGFAVVAEEVRNLAQRSAQAARDTAAKIEGAIGKTAQGVEINRMVAVALSDIVGKARQVDELAAEVATASREQTQGITQITAAVAQMDTVVQQNAAGAEESASAAEELSAQAVVMRGSVAALLEIVEGQRGAESGSTPGGARTPKTPASRMAALGSKPPPIRARV